jgi:hypothetical protein
VQKVHQHLDRSQQMIAVVRYNYTSIACMLLANCKDRVLQQGLLCTAKISSTPIGALQQPPKCSNLQCLQAADASASRRRWWQQQLHSVSAAAAHQAKAWVHVDVQQHA